MLDKSTPSLSQIAANFLVKKHWQTLYEFVSNCMLHSKNNEFLKNGVIRILGLTENAISHIALDLILDSIKTQCIEKNHIDYWFQKDQLLEGVQYTYHHCFYHIDLNKTIAAAINNSYMFMPKLLSNFFIVAAHLGLLAELEMLWNEHPDEQLEMLQANEFNAFQSAAKGGQLAVLKFLWDKTPDNLKQDMLETEEYNPYIHALVHSQLDAVVFLWDIASDVQKENMFQIFIEAPTLEMFDDIDSDDAEFYKKFIIFLWNNITSDQKQRLLQKIIDDCFRENNIDYIICNCSCCFTGIPFIWDKINVIQKQELLDKFINTGIILAVTKGNMYIIVFFWEKLTAEQRQLALQKLVDYLIALPFFIRAHINAIPFLWDRLSNPQKELLLAKQEYSLLHDAASNATTSTLITLWNSASDKHKIGILESKNYKVFDILFLHERLDALKILWSYTSLEQKQHILQKLLDSNNIDFLPQLSVSSLKKIITILKEDATLELRPLLQKLGMHCGIILYPDIYDERHDPIELLKEFEESMEYEYTSPEKVMAQVDAGPDLQTLLQHTGMFYDPTRTPPQSLTTSAIDEYTNIRKSTLARKAEVEPEDEPDSKHLRFP